MSVPLILRPDADQDVLDARADFDRLRPGFGAEYADELATVFARIEFMPQIYGVTWRDVRAATLSRFHHVVYDIAYPDRAEVIAVMHGARRA